MNMNIFESNIYKSYFNILSFDNAHPLFSVIKSINKKSLDTYKKDLYTKFAKYDDRIEYEGIRSASRVFANTLFSAKEEYIPISKSGRIETGVIQTNVYAGGETFILENTYVADTQTLKENNDYSLYYGLYKYEKNIYSKVLEFNSKKEALNELYDHVLNKDISLFRFIGGNFIDIFVWFCYGSEREKFGSISDLYNLNKEYLDKKGLFGFDYNTTHNALNKTKIKTSDFTEFNGKDRFETALITMKGFINNLYNTNISDADLLDILHICEFAKYYETYTVIEDNNIFDEYKTFLIDQLNENSIDNPSVFHNKYMRKLHNISMDTITLHVWNNFLYGYGEDVGGEINSHIQCSSLKLDDNGNEIGRNYFWNYGAEGYSNHELRSGVGFGLYFSEIYSLYTENIICEYFNIDSYKGIRNLILNKQYDELSSFVNNGIIAEHDLYDLIYNQEGKVLKLNSINLQNDKIILSTDSGRDYTIFSSNIDIDSSYTSGIATKNYVNGIVMTGKSIKLSKIEFLDNGFVILGLSNAVLNIKTKSVKLRLD